MARSTSWPQSTMPPTPPRACSPPTVKPSAPQPPGGTCSSRPAVFATWTSVRWGELLAVEGWDGDDSPLQLAEHGIATYAVDWQLREIGGAVTKSAPKDGSYRVLDLPPFLADLMRWAIDNRQPTCHCPLNNGRRPAKATTPPNYLFVGPNGGHLRRSNYADRYLTPAAEGLYPPYNGVRRPVYVTAEPWPGIPIRKGNRKAKAADIADATWPNLTGKYTPHGDRHTHATWLEAADIHKIVQMDRRGHAMSGMDAIYTHITPEMRQRLCDVLEQLWQNALAQRHELSAQSAVPLLNQLLIAYEQRNNNVTATGPALPCQPREPKR